MGQLEALARADLRAGRGQIQLVSGQTVVPVHARVVRLQAVLVHEARLLADVQQGPSLEGVQREQSLGGVVQLLGLRAGVGQLQRGVDRYPVSLMVASQQLVGSWMVAWGQ